MSRRLPTIFMLLGLMGVPMIFTSPVHASKPVARVTGFQGEVRVLTDTTITPVTAEGMVLKSGDRLQTEQGSVEITFMDGAVMKVRPYTTTMVQEREEEKGWWLFKSKQAVRRVTVFVGKLWFKSGVSARKNYLQTPTAVCGIRGSDGDIGYDNLNTYLNMYSGEADPVGQVFMGFFEDPGISAAAKNAVYKALESAYQKAQQAAKSGKTLDLAAAKAQALEVIKAAAEELLKNPDETVRTEAQAEAQKAEKELNELKQQMEQLQEETSEETSEETTEETSEETTEETSEATTSSTSSTTSTTTTTTTSEETTVSPSS